MLKEDFARGENSEPAGPEHTDVEFPALDVRLDQRVALELLMNVSDSLDGLSLIADKRCLADAVGRLLAYRFDESGIGKALKTAERRETMGDHKPGQTHTMIREHFLRQRLVFTKKQSVRSGARIAYFHQLQQGRDVRFVRPVVVKGLGEVKNDIRSRSPQFFHDLGNIIED